MASYTVNKAGVEKARAMIKAKQYVLESTWNEVQPDADAENAYLERRGYDDYGAWHLALREGASQDTKGLYAFGFGDFKRLHRSALIACVYRAAEWKHKAVELAAHDLLQELDAATGVSP